MKLQLPQLAFSKNDVALRDEMMDDGECSLDDCSVTVLPHLPFVEI